MTHAKLFEDGLSKDEIQPRTLSFCAPPKESYISTFFLCAVFLPRPTNGLNRRGFFESTDQSLLGDPYVHLKRCNSGHEHAEFFLMRSMGELICWSSTQWVGLVIHFKFIWSQSLSTSVTCPGGLFGSLASSLCLEVDFDCPHYYSWCHLDPKAFFYWMNPITPLLSAAFFSFFIIVLELQARLEDWEEHFDIIWAAIIW